MKKLVMMVITILLAVGVFSGTEVEAASKKQKALKAYAAYLENQYADEFAVADINGDGVKELFTSTDMYIYKSGKVVHCLYRVDFRYSFYPSKNYIYYNQQYLWDGASGYYRLTKKGTIIQLAAHRRIGDDDLAADGLCEKESHTYFIKEKKVSKKKYDAYVKKLKKGAKELNLKYHKNTAKNRKKYLKG